MKQSKEMKDIEKYLSHEYFGIKDVWSTGLLDMPVSIPHYFCKKCDKPFLRTIEADLFDQKSLILYHFQMKHYVGTPNCRVFDKDKVLKKLQRKATKSQYLSGKRDKVVKGVSENPSKGETYEQDGYQYLVFPYKRKLYGERIPKEIYENIKDNKEKFGEWGSVVAKNVVDKIVFAK